MNKEIEMTKEVKKYGDSLILTLGDEKKILNLNEGDLVKIKIQKIKNI